MATRKTTTTKKKKEKDPEVLCSQCKNSERDTSGISFNIDTKEFFMGTCHEGLGMGPKSKVFMDTPKRCKKFIEK